jgi:hypothetical protein
MASNRLGGSMSILNLFEEDSKNIELGQDTSTLAELIQQRMLVNSQLLAAREVLKEKENLLKEYDEKMLPEKMQELKITEFKLDSGNKVKLSEKFFASIYEEEKPEAYKYLKENGFGHIIKESYILDAKKDSETKEKIKKVLIENKIPFSEKMDIHWSTLRSFVRDMLEKRDDLKSRIPCFEPEDDEEAAEVEELSAEELAILNFDEKLFNPYAKLIVEIK